MSMVLFMGRCCRRGRYTDLGALCLLARDEVFGFVALVKDNAAVKGGPSAPVHHLLQPPLALQLGDQGGVRPVRTKQALSGSPRLARQQFC